MPGRITELSESQIIADLLKDRRRLGAAVTSVQMPQPAKDTFTIAATPATTYTLTAIPYQGTDGSSLNLSLNGVELIEGVDYTCDYTTAIVTVSATLKGTPTPADVLTADYWTTGDLIALSGTVVTGLLTITDTFNRADAPSLGTTSDGTATWSKLTGSVAGFNPWGPNGFAILGNAAQSTSGAGTRDGSVIDTATTDGSMTMTISQFGSQTKTLGFIIRLDRAGGNHLFAEWNRTSGNFEISEVYGGGFVSAGASVAGSLANGDVLTVTFTGTAVALVKNGTTILSYTSLGTTGTERGITVTEVIYTLSTYYSLIDSWSTTYPS